MNFQKLIETRFADPVTALDISARYICYGSAMGRIAFYNIKDDKDLALSDSQPELIRGVSINNLIFMIDLFIFLRSLIQRKERIYS
jgi:hypothetical protein